jgi:(2Fe-2S) ferredoxin
MYYQKHIFICTNQRAENKACCANHDAAAACTYVKLKVKQLGLAGNAGVRVSSAGCLGRCELGPVAVIYPEGVWYHYNNTQDLETIINTHLIEGKVVKELQLPDIDENI